MTEEQKVELQKIKDECNLFHEQMVRRLNDFCNSLGYHDSCNFSYNVDRLDHFIGELNGFKERKAE